MERLPLFERNLVKKMAEQRLRTIAEAIAFRIEQEPEPGLLTGLAGEAVFLYQYGRTMGSDRYENLGFLALERALQRIDEGFSWPSFAAGLAGIRAALQYLAERHFIGADEGNALEPILPYLHRFAAERLAAGDYDYLHGALGIHTPLNSLNPLNPLNLSSLPFPWPSRNPKTGLPEINLGLAHGIPSILVCLSQQAAARPDDDPQRQLLSRGMEYLLGCELDRSANGSLFPHRMVDGKPDQPGRLAWCYGDPGIGAAVWQSGANTGNALWREEGIRILRRAAGRTSTRANRINDACLCHGTAGLALIFFKMGILTGHDELIDAANRWMLATLDHGAHESPSAGYLYLTTGNRYVPSYGLLEGITGTGLAILSLLETENLGWEKFLLL